jgi:energy-coupling factor transport system permease protein
MKKDIIDPRTKLIVLVLINIIVFANSSELVGWIGIGIIFMLSFYMGAPRIALCGILVYILLSGALCLCTLFPSVPSTFVSVIAVCIKSFFPLVWFSSAFIATTKVSHLICAMQKWRIPKSIVIVLSVVMRFFPCVYDDFSRAKDAMRLRGITFSMSNLLSHPLKVFEYALIPFMLRCANMTEELSAAALVRGIENEKKRTSIWVLRFTFVDFVVLFLFSALTLFALIKVFWE